MVMSGAHWQVRPGWQQPLAPDRARVLAGLPQHISCRQYNCNLRQVTGTEEAR